MQRIHAPSVILILNVERSVAIGSGPAKRRTTGAIYAVFPSAAADRGPQL